MRRFLLLVNARSRGGDAEARLQGLLRRPPLSQHDVSTQVFRDDAGIRRGLQSLGGERIPVAVGGDGTVASVVRVLRAMGHGGAPLGVLPLGTGNALCHSLGMADVHHALQALAQGQARPLDLMTTTHPQASLSLLNISVGLESLMMADFQAWRRRSRVLAALIGCARHPWRRFSGVSISVDGVHVLRPTEAFCNAGLYNMPCYGFGLRPRPAADPVDGLADLRLFHGRGRYLAYLGAAVLGRAAPAGDTSACHRVHGCRICSPLPLQIDGETVASADFQVTVVREGLQVLTPG